jgi:hypothetical protein
MMIGNSSFLLLRNLAPEDGSWDPERTDDPEGKRPFYKFRQGHLGKSRFEAELHESSLPAPPKEIDHYYCQIDKRRCRQ